MREMKILQIANGYFDSRLYALLFSAMEQNSIKNQVYVPIRKDVRPPENSADHLVAVPNFTQLDRALFYSKQRKMRCDIEERSLWKGADIIHAHTVFSGGYTAWRLHKKYDLPYIVAVRNTDVNTFFKYMVHLRKTGVKIMREAEKVIFLSPAYRSAVLQKNIPAKYRREIAEKSVVIPNGISQLFFDHLAVPKTLADKSAVRLIYVGEISRNKNMEETISACGLLREKGYAVSLTAVGAISDESYRVKISDCDFIEYHEKCPQEEVLQYMRQADIFVMPSHTETFGLAYAEAMSQGLPVLYTRGQGFDGQFPDGTVGYAVSDTDAADLAEKIKLTIQNYTELSENCIRLAKKFRWEDIAKEYGRIYEAAIKNHVSKTGKEMR